MGLQNEAQIVATKDKGRAHYLFDKIRHQKYRNYIFCQPEMDTAAG